MPELGFRARRILYAAVTEYIATGEPVSSRRLGKRYGLDNHGLIAKIKNPYDGNSSVVVVAGVRSAGTKSAVIALTNYSEEVLKKYSGEEDWALVVQGFDMNSDGKIDHVDIVSGL